MKKISLLFLLALFGCSDPDENASTNLRKGDEFFSRGEYEVADYYYDQIPETNPLYKSVLRRRQEMLKKGAPGTVPKKGQQKAVSKGEEVTITKHSHTLQMGRLPIHTISVLNNGTKRLNTMEMEFVYLDESGREVERLLTMVNANVDPGEEKEIAKIAPGMVTQKFSQVKIEIKRSLMF